ncbi:DNA mismatch repair protein Mlh3 [Parasteatoda tepidariorum]|uniref:DNA mismatch repair protein Mlh3 n=1 Tax=Parasteatoda tepidariorum TaxID=114398 RepID=UPI00077FCD58|nr:uncharacterized protein LOC107451793 [Parasteatoda tepidariorum]
MKVRELPSDVIKKIRSDVAFTTVAQCVEELVLNSIDADAKCIAVRLNLEQYKIQVVDNGHGISAEELQLVGERYATSKCHTIEDLNSLKYAGYRGEAISSLKNVSSNLMIETRAADSEKTFCKIFTLGNNDKVCPSLNQRVSKGTTVTVFDFMYNRPVRKNTISEALDLEETRKLLQSTALMHPQISFSLLNEVSGATILHFKKCSSTESAFMQLFGREKAKNLKSIDEKFEDYRINGVISMDCFLNRELQFLYVSKQPILRTNNLHKLINRTLCKFLCAKQKSRQESISTPNISSPSKTQAQYCAFVINISCPLNKYDSMFDRRHKVVEFSEWDKISGFIEMSILKLLKVRDFIFDGDESSDSAHLQNQNDLTSKLGVDNYKKGLFSHTAKRYDVVISFADKSNAISDKRNIAKSNKSSNFLCVEEENNLIKRLQFNEGDSNSQKFICLKKNSPCKSILDDLKLTCKTTLTNNKQRNKEKYIQTAANIVPVPKMSVQPNIGIDIPSRKVFPTKSPVMMRVPIKSNLSLLEKDNSILQKLREKYCYNPPKMKQMTSFPPKSSEENVEKHEHSSIKNKVIGHSKFDKTIDISQPLDAKVSQRVASKFTFSDDSNLSPLKRFRRTKTKQPKNEIIKVLTMGDISDHELANNMSPLVANLKERLETTKTINFHSHCMSDEKDETHTDNPVSNLRKRLPEFPLNTFNEDINMTSPSKIQRLNKHDKTSSHFKDFEDRSRISSSPNSSQYSKLNRTCLLEEFMPRINLETNQLMNNDASVIDSNNLPNIAQNGVYNSVICANDSDFLTTTTPKDLNKHYSRIDFHDKSSTDTTSSNSLEVNNFRSHRKKFLWSDSSSVSLSKPHNSICSSLLPINDGVLEHNSICDLEVSFNSAAHSTLEHNSIRELEIPFNHSCINTQKSNSVSEFKLRCNRNDVSNEGNSLDMVVQYVKSSTFYNSSPPKPMKEALISSSNSSSSSNPEISNAIKASSEILSNVSLPQVIKIPIITTKSKKPVKTKDKLEVEQFNSDEIFSLHGKNSNLDFHEFEGDESQISFECQNKLLNNNSEIEIIDQFEGSNVSENLSGSLKKSANHGHIEVDPEKINFKLNDEPCSVINMLDNKNNVEKGNRWVCQIDNETKRVSYVDTVTGNSTYVMPQLLQEESKTLEETVGFNNGTNKKHFFLTHDFSPFVKSLNSPITEKDDCDKDITVLQSHLNSCMNEKDKNEMNLKWRHFKETDNNIQDLFNKWENPMFEVPSEAVSAEDPKILQSLSHMYIINSYRFTKATLKSLKVIGQVDCKFIACLLDDFNEVNEDQKLLALFDQHAVHERIRLEELVKELYELSDDGEKIVKSITISPVLEITLDEDEVRLLSTYQKHLTAIGIKLSIKNESDIEVSSIPSCLIDQNTNKLKRSISEISTIIEKSIKEWLLSLTQNRCKSSVLPKTLSNVLNSQACRGAVKFGDPLTLSECENLLLSLSECKLPFQCAHGRPSIAPLLDLNKIDRLNRKRPCPQLKKLRDLEGETLLT